jgi:pre-rRNA-processing protein TSR3
MHTYFIRHRKENRKKCSLTPLEGDLRCTFLSYPFKGPLPDLSSVVLLSVDAPELSPADSGADILLVDATWRYAEKILKLLPMGLKTRSLPRSWQTAYPRYQEVSEGLASIEALYAAFHILGYNKDNLLDAYYWKEAFLEKNSQLLLD